jgi:hypothetical protein
VNSSFCSFTAMGRSRSRGRDDDKSKQDPPKPTSGEQEIVNVAIKQLPAEIRDRFEKLFEEGLLKEGDLDLRSVTVFASLNEGLQTRVMNHMENERIYVANARSKSGFLIATCDKAKTGCLDARGLGAIDPWRTALVAMATPKQKIVDLKPERDWLDTHDEAAIKLTVNLDEHEKDLGVPSITVELPPTECATAIKQKLVAMGLKSVPANKMKFHADAVGFLKDRHSFAYYNFEDGISLTLSSRKRGGSHLRRDHSVMPKKPKTQSAPAAATAPAKSAPGGLGGLPGMTMPKMSGPLGGLAGIGLGGTAPGGLPGLPGLGGLGGCMPKLGGLPGLPGLPALGGPRGLPALPGIPGPGGTGPGTSPGGLPALPGLGGLPQPGGLPKLGMPGGLSFPGLPPVGADPKAAAEAMMASMKNGPGGLPMPGGLPVPGAAMSKAA